MINYKTIWQSKIFWVNVLSIALEILQVISGVNWIPSGTLVIIVNVLNIFLRRLTDQPVRFKNDNG